MKLKRQLAPGFGEDDAGCVHISIPEILARLKIDDTPENRDKLSAMVAEMAKKQWAAVESRGQTMSTNIEKILLVAKGLQTFDHAKATQFTFFFLGMLTSHVIRHPGASTDDLVNGLTGCGAMFGIANNWNPGDIENWTEAISSAPAGESKQPTDAGASESQSERK
jgi:hypothetical protein